MFCAPAKQVKRGPTDLGWSLTMIGFTVFLRTGLGRFWPYPVLQFGRCCIVLHSEFSILDNGDGSLPSANGGTMAA